MGYIGVDVGVPMSITLPGIPRQGQAAEIRIVEEARAGARMSTVDFGGSTKTVCLAYLPEMQVGEYTIVHAGFAISRLDEESALAQGGRASTV